MSEDPKPEVVATLEDDTGDFCVDVLRHAEGHFSYLEYARDPEDEDAWHQRADGDTQTYKTQYAAYAAATRNVAWLID